VVVLGFMAGVLLDLRSIFCSEDCSIRILFLLCPGNSSLLLFTATGVLSGSLILFRFSDIPFSFFTISFSFTGATFFSFASVSCSLFQLLDNCAVFPLAIFTIPGIIVVLLVYFEARKNVCEAAICDFDPRRFLARQPARIITVATSSQRQQETAKEQHSTIAFHQNNNGIAIASSWLREIREMIRLRRLQSARKDLQHLLN